jgi:hypothetical protein
METIVANRYSPDCTPGYYNNEGRDIERHVYAGTMVSFLNLIGQWRTQDDLDGLELVHDRR